MTFLVFPHQLFENIDPLKGKKVLLIEEPLYFTYYKFHIQKLVMHRASMKFYEKYLRENRIVVEYFENELYLSLYQYEQILSYDVADYYLKKKLEKNFVSIQFLQNPSFLNVHDDTKFFHSYYINRRKDLNILLDEDQKPIGGKWSFDTQNRKKLPKDEKTPVDLAFENRYLKEAVKYCKKFDTVGNLEDVYFPTTFSEAKTVLKNFLAYKFVKFGEFQDAITKEDSFLFHSNISSALNTGLLDIHDVIFQTLAQKDVPLNAKEGFIRQIIGWREFMFQTYKSSHISMRNANFFECKNSIPEKILEGNSGIDPLDGVMKKVHTTAYAHHIERLMILGNIFLLLEIEPNKVHDFFMSYFIDAYDWVMVANVYGMSGFSDGGSITTKPYIASSNYILKMSNYKKGEWCEILDGLYWSFMNKHYEKFENNPRMKMQIALLKKMNPKKLEKHIEVANQYKEFLGLI